MVFFAIAGEMFLGFVNSNSETNHAWDIFGATTKATFLATTNREGLNFNAMSKIQRADTLRAATFRSIKG